MLLNSYWPTSLARCNNRKEAGERKSSNFWWVIEVWADLCFDAVALYHFHLIIVQYKLLIWTKDCYYIGGCDKKELYFVHTSCSLRCILHVFSTLMHLLDVEINSYNQPATVYRMSWHCIYTVSVYRFWKRLGMTPIYLGQKQVCFY